jgi:hypothetical protein
MTPAVCESFWRARCEGRLIDPATGRPWARRLTAWLRSIIESALAARLADRLERLESSPLTKTLSGKPTLQKLAEHDLITTGQWRALTAMVALNGMRVSIALRRAAIPPAIFKLYLRAEPRLQAAFDRAKRHAHQRHRKISAAEAEEILAELSRTDASLKAILRRRGYSRRVYEGFLKRLWRQPELRSRYLVARRAKVARCQARFFALDDDTLIERGKRWIHQEAHRIRAMQPMRERRRAAQQYREESL